jgi:hypothetical protein
MLDSSPNKVALDIKELKKEPPKQDEDFEDDPDCPPLE